MSTQSLQDVFNLGQTLFNQGKLTQSKSTFTKLLSQASPQKTSLQTFSLQLIPNLHYSALINLSTIQLQLNNLQEAKRYTHRAIQINQHRYEAFYNLAILEFYSQGKLKITEKCLKLSLSRLYLQLALQTNSLRLVNKSLSLQKQNFKTNIGRALIYQNQQKIKLAQNQFERLTFQIDERRYTSQSMMQIYAQKAMFYRRINKIQKMEENLILYHKCRKQTQQQTSQNKQNKKSFYLQPQSNEDIQQQKGELKQGIRQMIAQVKDLIGQISEQKSKYNIMQQSPRKQLLLAISSSNNIPSRQNIPVSTNQLPLVSNIQPLQQQNHLWQQDSQHSALQNINEQSHPSLSINQDYDSAILNQKIEKLQRQIEQSGGNVPEIKDNQRNTEEEENFLEFQIQKTLQQINKKRAQEIKTNKLTHMGNNQEVNRQSKQYNNMRGSAFSASYNRRDSITSEDKQDTLTLRSVLSETYLMDLQEIKKYIKFRLQIRSVSMFDQKYPKKQAYVKVKFLDLELKTQKCKNDKLSWNQVFDQQQMKHATHECHYLFQLQVYAQQGGWLSWHKDILLGTGVINLTERGQTKCTLSNNDKKVGMLYYKLKLTKASQ